MEKRRTLLDSRKVQRPESLRREEMIQILETYCIPFNIKNYNQEQLLNLFNRIALPLPQRQYDNSRRGKYLMSLRAKRTNKAEPSKEINGTGDNITDKQTKTDPPLPKSGGVGGDEKEIAEKSEKTTRRNSEENSDSSGSKKPRRSKSPIRFLGPSTGSSGRIIIKRAPLPSQEEKSADRPPANKKSKS